MTERKLISIAELVLWCPIKDGALYGNRQWWFARYQGRFYNFYLHAN